MRLPRSRHAGVLFAIAMITAGILHCAEKSIGSERCDELCLLGSTLYHGGPPTSEPSLSGANGNKVQSGIVTTLLLRLSRKKFVKLLQLDISYEW
jgi:hypothetical protein